MARSDPDYLRCLALRMYWDGEENPSVAVPLGDFFGNGFTGEHWSEWPMGVSAGGFRAYLPILFRHRARIAAENGTAGFVDAFYFNADLELGSPHPGKDNVRRWSEEGLLHG